ncbi:T9SS type A sorting domain-containing protein [Bacteroidota bacterium]
MILNGGFNRTAGNWSQGTADTDGSGFLQFDFNGTFSSGDDWQIDNLYINPGNGNSLVNADNIPYVINKVLWLWSGTLNQNSAGNLTLADNGSIWRSDGIISAPMTFGDRANLMYKDMTGSYNIGQEWPVLPLTLMQSVILETPGQTVTLTGDRQINASLGLYDGTLDIDDNTLTLIEGANWELKESGVIDLTDVDAELIANNYHLVYLEGNITTNLQGEFPNQESNILSVNIIEDAYVTLNADKQITGPLEINVNEGSGLDFDDFTLSVTGDVTVNRDCFFNTGAAAGKLSLNGTSVQNINVPPVGLKFPVTGDDAALQINNTSSEGVNLVGGNLTMDNTSRNHLSVVDFVQGTFNTGDNQLVLWHTDDGIEPVQGFTRNVGVDGYSHVVGNVRKFIDATGFYTPNYAGIALARVDFPVGSAPETAGYYRPLTAKFSTLPSTGFFLTISHTNTAPEGIEGLPVDAFDSGDNPIRLSHYRPFYWTVSPTVTVQQIVSYDVELSIEGFEDYLTDGIDNVRLIKRDDGDINEEWEFAGADEYDNSVINDIPIILMRNAIDALESPGQQFAVGIKSKMSAGTISDVTVEAPGPWTYTLSNLNITGNLGELIYSVTSSNPLVAAASISNGVLTVTPIADGWTKITVRAIDVDDDLIAVSFTFTYDSSTDITDITEIPHQFSLMQNYPNPFNPSTTIRFGLPNAADVVIKVYNVLGQEIATLLNQPMNAGYHEIEFDASRLTSGLYIYRIEAGEFISNKKMILLK